MAKRMQNTTRESRQWFAPPGGGYSATPRPGKSVDRPKKAPDNAARVSSSGSSGGDASK